MLNLLSIFPCAPPHTYTHAPNFERRICINSDRETIICIETTIVEQFQLKFVAAVAAARARVFFYSFLKPKNEFAHIARATILSATSRTYICCCFFFALSFNCALVKCNTHKCSYFTYTQHPPHEKKHTRTNVSIVLLLLVLEMCFVVIANNDFERPNRLLLPAIAFFLFIYLINLPKWVSACVHFRKIAFFSLPFPHSIFGARRVKERKR